MSAEIYEQQSSLKQLESLLVAIGNDISLIREHKETLSNSTQNNHIDAKKLSELKKLESSIKKNREQFFSILRKLKSAKATNLTMVINQSLSSGKSLLWIAAECGDVQCLKALIELGADTNAKNANGVTATYIAAAGLHTHCVVLLLSAGANPTIPDPYENIQNLTNEQLMIKDAVTKAMKVKVNQLFKQVSHRGQQDSASFNVVMHLLHNMFCYYCYVESSAQNNKFQAGFNLPSLKHILTVHVCASVKLQRQMKTVQFPPVLVNSQHQVMYIANALFFHKLTKLLDNNINVIKQFISSIFFEFGFNIAGDELGINQCQSAQELMEKLEQMDDSSEQQKALLSL